MQEANAGDKSSARILAMALMYVHAGRAGSPAEGRRQAALRGIDAMAAAMLDDSPPSGKTGAPVRSKKKKAPAKSLEVRRGSH
jgi:hypothetical protein